jgi:hypothetical protein
MVRNPSDFISPLSHRRQWLTNLVAAGFAGWASSCTWGGDGPRIDPTAELDLPKGEAIAGQGRRVRLRDRSGRPVVGEVLVEVQGELVVRLPNGRLQQISGDDAPATDDPFQGLSPRELGKQLAANEFSDFRVQASKRHLFLYQSSDEFLEGTSRILNSMFPKLVTYCKRMRLPAKDPDVPLVVIIFRSEDDFDTYDKMPDGVLAYYNQITNYVVMYEQSRLAQVAPELAIKQAISTIAHEGVHQILHNIGVQQRLSRWPMWIAEGLPEYCAPTSVDKRVKWKGLGEVNDLRMSELERYLSKPPEKLQSGDLIRQTVAKQQLNSTGYAVAWALTHFLAEKRHNKYEDYLREVSQLGPLESLADGGTQLFEKHFGGEYDELEQELVKHLQSLPYSDPVANQTHYVVQLELDDGARMLRRVGVTTSPAAVKQWQQETLVSVPPQARHRARFNVQAFGNKILAQQYADQWLQSR